MNQEVLKKLYTQTVGVEPTEVIELPSSGSNRHYYRLKSEGKSLIGAIGTNLCENEAFLYMDEHFCEKGLNVP